MPVDRARVRLAVMADIHFSKTSPGTFQALFEQVTEEADVLALCGDLTDYGLPEEAKGLAREISNWVKIPVVGILGNHDFESGEPDEVNRILCDAGISMLDGDACEVHGVGFAGTKGFAGGFGRGTLGYWGEPAIKAFVREALDEALKLENALQRLRTSANIVLLHYSPIEATVVGEPCEIHPYLGSSRLEEPLTRFPVDAVFHGHAHHGTHEGTTAAGVPVYNVSMPLLRATYPDKPPFKLMEFGTGTAKAAEEEQKPEKAHASG